MINFFNEKFFKYLKPLEIFHLPGLIIFFYFLINTTNIFSIEITEWILYFLIYILGSVFFIFSFFDYKQYYKKLVYFFSLIFILFIFFNFNFSKIHIIFLIISFLLTFTLNDFNYKKFLKIDNFSKLLYFFITLEITLKLFYWVKFNQYFWKDINNILENIILFKSYTDNFFPILKLQNSSYISLAKYIQFIYPIVLLIFIIFIIFLFVFFIKKQFKINFINKYWWLFPSLIFFIESFSTSHFFSKYGGGTMVHWQAFTGTIEMMQNNGYLLWDTPSQYGFLSLIFIYLVPSADPWMKFYLLNGILTFITSLLFFRLLWNKNNLAWYILAFLISWSLMYIMTSGYPFANSSSTPSSGPIRFFWLILLSFSIVSLKNHKIFIQLIIILPLWLIGFLWSFESAFYVSSIIFPYLIYILFFLNYSFLKRIIFFLSFPFFLLLTSIVIFIYYNLSIGHFPDLYSFVEYTISFRQGFYAEEINFLGGLWIPILILSWIIIKISDSDNVKDKFLIFSIWCGLWSVCSYGVGRSLDIVFFKQSYLYIFFLFLVIKLIGFKKTKIYFFSPIFIILIVFTFTNSSFFQHLHQTISNQDYSLKNTNHHVTKDYNEILTIINPGKIPVIYMEPGRHKYYNSKKEYKNQNTGQIQYLNNKIWLPIHPATIMDPLIHKRRIVYVERWIERHNIDKGWIINPIADHWHQHYDVLIDEILKDYNKLDLVVYGKLKAILYEKK